MAVSGEPRRRWRSEDEPDPLRPLHVMSWRLFLALPVLVALGALALGLISFAVGATLVTIFLFSFAIMTPVAVFVTAREVIRRLARWSAGR